MTTGSVDADSMYVDNMFLTHAPLCFTQLSIHLAVHRAIPSWA